MTREERENAIRCLKMWIEREPQLQTYRTCLEALEQEPVYFFPPCVDCNTKMNEIREAYDKLKMGRWIKDEENRYHCSECGRTVKEDCMEDIQLDYPFCHCGAKMVESEE